MCQQAMRTVMLFLEIAATGAVAFAAACSIPPFNAVLILFAVLFTVQRFRTRLRECQRRHAMIAFTCSMIVASAVLTIAAIHKISPSTFARWKRAAKEQGDNWDIARSASIIAGEGVEVVVSTVIEEFMIMAQSLLEEIKNGNLNLEQKVKSLVSLADAMTKMTASAGKLAPKISELGVAQDVLSQMLDFVRVNIRNILMFFRNYS